jgi:ABC-2 type transport system permease protein
MVTQPAARWWALSRTASVIGFATFRSMYTPWSWLFGWCLRLVFQVVFFALIGLLLGNSQTVDYLLVGNVVAVAGLEATSVIVALSRERWLGTLPLMAATPAGIPTMLLMSNINWPVTALLSAAATLLVCAVAFGLSVSAASVVLALPVVFVCAVSAFGYGSAIGVMVLRAPSLDFTMMNVAYLTLMTFTGVNVPVSFWPAPIRQLAQLMPLTHGLEAVRGLLGGRAPTAVLAEVGAEVAVAAGWLTVAVLLIRRFVEQARRAGRLELG